MENHKLAHDNKNAICAGPFGTIFKAKDFRDQGVPIIFLRHVKEGGFNQKKPKYMDNGVWNEFHQEYSVFGGELLVTKLGDPPGEACIYPNDIGTAMVTPDVLKMDVDSRVAHANYLKYFFNSPVCKEVIKDLAFGATRLRIDIPMFKTFPIPTPPLEEQDEIVMRVESLFAQADSVEEKYNEARRHVDRLTQSLLTMAFRGDLVKQDPNDEPAKVLLRRIKAKRAESTSRKNSKPKASKKKTTKRTRKMTSNDIETWLKAADKSIFTFEELESQFPNDYEKLKEAVFEMLAAKEPLMAQSFDQDLGIVNFKMVS